MIVGVPREIKAQEYRVALTDEGVAEFVKNGHSVLIEKNAGAGSSIPDESYVRAGAKIIDSVENLWRDSDLILKVKEPIEAEYSRIRPNQIMFTYLHLAASRALTDALIASKATCIAYETVEVDGALPLLVPMSEVAGRMATDVAKMKPGSVLVDIAIDQGGCFEDSRATTHENPTYRVHDSVFYCVANMPGAVPVTSTYALTNVTLPFALQIANLGWGKALKQNLDLAKGLNTHDGKVTYKAVAEAHGYQHSPVF